MLRAFDISWSNKTKQAIQLGYANRIIYSDIIIRFLSRCLEGLFHGVQVSMQRIKQVRAQQKTGQRDRLAKHAQILESEKSGLKTDFFTWFNYIS